MPEYRIVKHSWFNVPKVKTEISYSLERLHHFLKWSWWAPETYGNEFGVYPYSGNREWARKIAKHFKIKMPV